MKRLLGLLLVLGVVGCGGGSSPSPNDRLAKHLREMALRPPEVSSQSKADKSPAQPAAPSSDWPQFLGPARNGISAETGLLETFPAGGLKPAWRARGGIGMAAVAVSGGKAVTMVQDESSQMAVALDARTGKMLWRTAIAPAYKSGCGGGNGTRATPAITGGQVFTFSGEGILTALSLADGTVTWSDDCLQRLGGEQADCGMACSPLVEGGKVIVTVGAPAATVVAYGLKTGKQAWVAGKGDPAGYSSPAMLNVGGTRQLVVLNGRAAMGINPADGSLLWRYDYVTPYQVNIATPLAFKGSVFLSAGCNHGATMLSLHKTGGTFQANPGWESSGPRSVMRNEWQTSILLDGYFYGFDNVGSGGPVTHLTCVDATTGKRMWQVRRFGKGNLIAADGKLFMTTMKGELVVAAATPKAYRELGRAKVLETTRQAPTLAGGLLYVRDNNEIVCFDVRKP